MKEFNLWKMWAAPSGAVPGSLLPGTLGAVWGLREVPERLRVKLGSGNLVGFVFLHRLGLQWSLCSAGRANIGAL